MQKVIDSLTGIGGLLFIVGFISLCLNLMGLDFKALSFLDTWGNGTTVRVGMVVVGIVLIAIGVKWGTPDPEDAEGAEAKAE